MRSTLRHLLFGQPPFSPRNLFLSGEVGAWYEPGSLDTLFEFSNGTTLVASDGRPVGLVLDKSKGLALGPELVTNGGFDSSATGWGATNCTLAVVSGELEVTGTTTSAGYATQTVSVTSGKVYNVTFTARLGTAASGYVQVRNATAGTILSTTTLSVSNVTTSVYVTPSESGIIVRLGHTTATLGVTAYFDNISVRELTGSHALQSSSTLRPTYKVGPNRLYFDADPDALTITFPSAPGNSTLAYGVSGGEPVITYPVNISGKTYTIDPSVIGTFGPELVTKGDFSGDNIDGWSNVGCSLSVVSGQLEINGSGGVSQASYPIPVVAGVTYKISASMQSNLTVTRSVTVRDSTSTSSTSVFTVIASTSATGQVSSTVYYTAATTTTVYLAYRAATTTQYYADNISVKELTGAAAQNTGLVIVNRALTAAETVKLTQYLKARS